MTLAQLKTLNLTDQLPVQGSTGNQPETIYAKQLTQELLEIAITDQNGKCLGVSRNQKIYLRPDDWVMKTPQEYIDAFGYGTSITEFIPRESVKNDTLANSFNSFNNIGDSYQGVDWFMLKTEIVKLNVEREIYQELTPLQLGSYNKITRTTYPYDRESWEEWMDFSPMFMNEWQKYMELLVSNNYQVQGIKASRIGNMVPSLLTGDFTVQNGNGTKTRIVHKAATAPTFLTQSSVNILQGTYVPNVRNIIYIQCYRVVENMDTHEFDVWIYQKQ